jgi:hypothetical protein
VTTTSQILSNGLSEILAHWRARHSGERDPLYWLLRLQLARVDNADRHELERVPEALRADIARRHTAIVAYWDNVRYALLDPLAAVWGTAVNGLRVATNVPSVTPEQKKAFDTSIESVVVFCRSAHESPACEGLYQAFRPMPAPDCQALAALLHPNASLDARGIVGLMRMLSAEGPLTEAESEALSVLNDTGLAMHSYHGARRGG